MKLLALFSLLGLFAGAIGSYLLAQAFGPISPDTGVSILMAGKAAVVVQRPEYFTWGIRLIGVAFTLQLPLALSNFF